MFNEQDVDFKTMLIRNKVQYTIECLIQVQI